MKTKVYFRLPIPISSWQTNSLEKLKHVKVVPSVGDFVVLDRGESEFKVEWVYHFLYGEYKIVIGFEKLKFDDDAQLNKRVKELIEEGWKWL